MTKPNAGVDGSISVRDGHRMEGSGLFIINPPYGTETEAARTEKMFKLLK